MEPRIISRVTRLVDCMKAAVLRSVRPWLSVEPVWRLLLVQSALE